TGHLFIFNASGDHRDLHSFPTRRSSDLSRRHSSAISAASSGVGSRLSRASTSWSPGASPGLWRRMRSMARETVRVASSRQKSRRSEEHTSELQSRENLVCRLLLEKKKKT